MMFRSDLLAATCAAWLAVAPFTAASAAPQPASFAEGQRLYRQDCAGCHKWHGGGGGGYGGAALSLRKTQLDRAQIIETIGCGRPGTGMPYHLRDAYTDAHPCYGMKSLAALGQNKPQEADSFLRAPEIAAVADYVLAAIKGKGAPDLEDCRAFFGGQSRVCDVYRKGGTEASK